jgi:flavodoxin I
MKAALIYGSCTGNTGCVAELLIANLKPEVELETVDVNGLEAEDLTEYDFALCGIPTWDIGELEYGWQEIYDNLDDVDLSKLTVAMFGLGDQGTYDETYQDAMGILYKKLLECGATGGLGFTSTETHEFEGSLGVIDGMFCGLALDEDGQSELTEERIQEWAASIKEAWPSIVETIESASD